MRPWGGVWETEMGRRGRGGGLCSVDRGGRRGRVVVGGVVARGGGGARGGRGRRGLHARVARWMGVRVRPAVLGGAGCQLARRPGGIWWGAVLAEGAAWPSTPPVADQLPCPGGAPLLHSTMHCLHAPGCRCSRSTDRSSCCWPAPQARAELAAASPAAASAAGAARAAAAARRAPLVCMHPCVCLISC